MKRRHTAIIEIRDTDGDVVRTMGICSVCGQSEEHHAAREPVAGVELTPLCCPGCECGSFERAQGLCALCDELGCCMAAVEGRQQDCPRELALREQQIADGDWLIR